MKTDKLLSSFQSFLEKECGGHKKNHFLLTVSGGLDSVVMTDLFFKSNYSFSIAHCNFNLRGDESKGDEMFVKQLADKCNAKIYVAQFETLSVAKAENISIQMAARNLRYEWFEKLRVENNLDFIATAHHNDDSTETVLLNIVRGAGVEGLKGIVARNNFVIRPLLFASRKEILDYATDNNLQWRDDSSNASTDYQRNFIRHKILPLLKEINPSVQFAIKNLSTYSNESILLINELINNYRNTICHWSEDEFIIDTEKISTHPAKATILHYLLADTNFNAPQIESIALSLERTGAVFYSNTHRLSINRKQLIASALHNKIENIELQIAGSNEVIPLTIGKIKCELLKEWDTTLFKRDDSSVAFVDFAKIKFPLTIRKWEKGDYFYPLGMDHKKKLSDYFTDEKFSLADKEKAWVITNSNTSDDEIIWVVNHRLDNRYKITDASTQVLKIAYIP